MNIEISPLEARVIGCLIEKQITTPDQYPLSLNALLNACNQKSNRDPVMDLEEAAVQRTVDALAKRHLVVERSGFGSRVPKYQHRFCNTEFGVLKFEPQELAVVCELLLRGPQTPGELRARASRMAAFADVSEVEAVLTKLVSRDDGPFLVQLPREPGRRESRYAHLFSGAVAISGPEESGRTPISAQSARAEGDATGTSVAAPEVSFPATLNDQRLVKLEAEVQALRGELEDLKRRLGG